MAHGQETSTSTEQGQGAPALCASGCGFYGSAATKNMCSKCYRDHLKTTIDGSAGPAAGKKTNTAAGPAAGTKKKTDAATVFKDPTSLQQGSSAAVAAADQQSPDAEAATAKAPNRCMSCKKKVGLLGFSCRCGGTFCSRHRYTDGHACDLDYKKFDREKIAQENPLVVAPKITKI